MMKNIVKLITAATITSFVCNSALISAGAGGTREVNVATVEELHAALTDAKPGDKIIIAPGVYQNDTWKGKWAAFFSEASGTAEQPITICSADPANPAVLCGVSQEDKIALYITGKFWNIENLVACEAEKGIVLDQGSHSTITGCEVYNIGDEGIHLRDDTSYCLIENCNIHDCGTVNPKYGEGIYIGSAKNNTDYGFDCHYNTVRSCTISNVGAECIDVKEYTIGTLIEGCSFDGSGVKGENGANSLIEIKGNDVIVRNNTGYRNGNEQILYAVDLYMAVDGWGQDSRIYDNKFYMDSEDIPLVSGWNCASYVFRNESEPVSIAVSGNEVIDVKEFVLQGDANGDGLVNVTDAVTLQDFLLAKPEYGHLSWKNVDLYEDGKLNAFDLCLLKRQLLSGESHDPVTYVNYNMEDVGKWRFTNGLDGHTLHVTLKAEPGCSMTMGWGYWDSNVVNEETGKLGKWIQFSLGTIKPDDNGVVKLDLELPDATRRTALEVWDYMNGSEKADKNEVIVENAWF